MDNWNVLSQVANESDAIVLKFGLTLQQIMDVVSSYLHIFSSYLLSYLILFGLTLQQIMDVVSSYLSPARQNCLWRKIQMCGVI